ncbi:hypothetical protein [Cryobacterium zongtaii]|uniref:hypothetical protein n=1 Tax=Cryobacterium zongtaii TaxID=1259217 RepID=UPI0010571151|nr:hypothetical protein [Cryobacterium zongtaii]
MSGRLHSELIGGATSSWYFSVVCAALAYNFGAFVIFLIRIPAVGGGSRVPDNYFYLGSAHVLAFLALGAVCRILSSSVLRTRDSTSGVVLGDLCVLLLAVGVVATIVLPLDSSGAGVFGIMVYLFWGVPVTALLSGFSIIVEQYAWLQILLTVTLIVHVALYIVGLAFQIAS